MIRFVPRHSSSLTGDAGCGECGKTKDLIVFDGKYHASTCFVCVACLHKAIELSTTAQLQGRVEAARER